MLVRDSVCQRKNRIPVHPGRLSNFGDVHRRLSPRAKTYQARELRKHQTGSERKAWELLRNRRMFGLKFRRQHVVDGFILDFYCAELRMAIEIDGGVHQNLERQNYDAVRDTWFAARSIHVIRVRNEEVDAHTLHRRIQAFITSSPSPHSRRGG